MEQECQLLAGPAAAAAQIVLLAVVLSSLAYKRYKEVPQRPWRVWLLDVSKQCCSSGAAHIFGMLWAMIASQLSKTASECAWYFVVFTVDTTVGVACAVYLHKLVVWSAQRLSKSLPEGPAVTDCLARLCQHVIQVGSYGEPISYTRWFYQLLVWVFATIVGRVVCGALVLLAAHQLQYISIFLDTLFEGHPALLLFFVMVTCPLLMNLAQAWIQDHVLKRKSTDEKAVQRQEWSLVPLVQGPEPQYSLLGGTAAAGRVQDRALLASSL